MLKIILTPNKMISKQAVLEIIKVYREMVDPDLYEMYKQIKELPSISDGWISVDTGGYPKTQGDGIEYLCAYEKSTRRGIFNYEVLWYEDDKWMNCKYDNFDINADLLFVSHYKQITDPTTCTN